MIVAPGPDVVNGPDFGKGSPKELREIERADNFEPGRLMALKPRLSDLTFVGGC